MSQKLIIFYLQSRRSFYKECPDGKLTQEHLTQLFKRVYPAGDAEKFCDHVFRVFNEGANVAHLDFKKFIMAMDVTYCQTEMEKLQWVFRLYDIDASGFIDRPEIEAIIKTMDQVEGRSFIKSVLDGNSKIKLKPVKTRAEELLVSFDKNNDGLISRDEFTEGYMTMHCTKNGKRRWSRGIGIWQTRALNMDKIIEGSNKKNQKEDTQEKEVKQKMVNTRWHLAKSRRGEAQENDRKQEIVKSRWNLAKSSKDEVQEEEKKQEFVKSCWNLAKISKDESQVKEKKQEVVKSRWNLAKSSS